MADTYTTPIPGASQYAQVELAAKSAYQTALARLNQQRQDTLHQYGYLGDVNGESGTIGNVRVDPHNPYGQYQELLQGAAVEAQGAKENVYGRGLYGGLANQAERLSKYNFGKSSSTLGTNLQNLLGDYQDRQNQAGQERDRAVTEAQLQAARDAIAQKQFNDALESKKNQADAALKAQQDQLEALKAHPGGYGAQPGEAIDAAGNRAPANIASYPLLNPSKPDEVFTPVTVGSTTSFEPKPTADNYIPAHQAPQTQQVVSSPKGPTIPAHIGGSSQSDVKFYTLRKEVPLGPGETLHFKAGYGYYAA